MQAERVMDSRGAESKSPDPIYNCPFCSHYIAPGALACPECGSLVYSAHLRTLAEEAKELEREGKWVEARAAWGRVMEWMPAGHPQRETLRGHVVGIDARLQAGEDKKAKWTKRLGPLAPVVFFLAKAKSAFFLLFKLKFLLSFFAFFGLYWALYGWKFGLGFTLSILIHETGHYVAVRRRGMKADLPMFLPGLGAYVRWYNQGMSLDVLAEIALAGPLFGLLTAGACLLLWHGTHQPIFRALTYAGAWLNLINLIPVFGLDGAQATYALNRLQRGLVLVSCVGLFAMMHEGVFLFIAAGMTWRMFTNDAPEQPSTRTLSSFLGLLFLLGAMVYMVPAGSGGMFQR